MIYIYIVMKWPEEFRVCVLTVGRWWLWTVLTVCGWSLAEFGVTCLGFWKPACLGFYVLSTFLWLSDDLPTCDSCWYCWERHFWACRIGQLGPRLPFWFLFSGAWPGFATFSGDIESIVEIEPSINMLLIICIWLFCGCFEWVCDFLRKVKSWPSFAAVTSSAGLSVAQRGGTGECLLGGLIFHWKG